MIKLHCCNTKKKIHVEFAIYISTDTEALLSLVVMQ